MPPKVKPPAWIESLRDQIIAATNKFSEKNGYSKKKSASEESAPVGKLERARKAMVGVSICGGGWDLVEAVADVPRGSLRTVAANDEDEWELQWVNKAMFVVNSADDENLQEMQHLSNDSPVLCYDDKSCRCIFGIKIDGSITNDLEELISEIGNGDPETDKDMIRPATEAEIDLFLHVAKSTTPVGEKLCRSIKEAYGRSR